MRRSRNTRATSPSKGSRHPPGADYLNGSPRHSITTEDDGTRAARDGGRPRPDGSATRRGLALRRLRLWCFATGGGVGWRSRRCRTAQTPARVPLPAGLGRQRFGAGLAALSRAPSRNTSDACTLHQHKRVVTDLARCPHVSHAGTTNSSKRRQHSVRHSHSGVTGIQRTERTIRADAVAHSNRQRVQLAVHCLGFRLSALLCEWLAVSDCHRARRSTVRLRSVAGSLAADCPCCGGLASFPVSHAAHNVGNAIR